MGEKSAIIIALTLVLLTTFASAEFSIDISGLKTEEYTFGEEITFKIILLENETVATQQVEYLISDALAKKEILGQATSNEDIVIITQNDFPSGLWTITANYSDAQVQRTFLIAEKSEVQFSIIDDELIIKNIGNIQYTKTIQIKIGTETNSYKQNIRVGQEKVLKLISADGTYDIEVTDGTTSIKREDVQLFGIGNVVGAVDRNLVGYTGFAGTEDPSNAEGRFISLKKLPLSLIFIAAIGILATLVFVERKLTKKKALNQ